MDKRTRADLIRELHHELITSTVKALDASKVYREETVKLARKHGGDWTAEYRIAKRDSQEVNDALKKHEWNRSNASFCAAIIATLMSPEVQRVVARGQ